MNFKENIILKAIIAMDENRVIGNNGSLPWHIPEDMKYFSKITKGHTVLMGRKTYDSLPNKFKPLPGRLNIVLSNNPNLNLPNDVFLINSLNDLHSKINSSEIKLPTDTIWVIGGAVVYDLLLSQCEEIYLTRVKGSHEGDTFLKEFENEFNLESSDPHENFTFEVYKRLINN